MKSFFVLASLLIAISIACSSYKSASSPTPANSPEAVSHASSPTPDVLAQQKTPCTLTLPGAPVIYGLKLGMTTDEVLAVFPGSKDDAELRSVLSRPPSQFGNSSFLITPSKFGDGAAFKEISRITFTTLDGRVSNFTLSHNGPEWPHVDKFVERFVEGTNLPAADQWEPYVGMDNQMKTLTCADFSIQVFAGGKGGNLNYVLLQDLQADKKLKERRRKAREQASPTPGQE